MRADESVRPTWSPDRSRRGGSVAERSAACAPRQGATCARVRPDRVERRASRLVPLACLLLTSCHRHAYSMPDCPAESMEALRVISAPAPAAPSTIAGVIVDSRAGRPVHGQVALRGPAAEARAVVRGHVTDSAGAFRFDSVPAGRYALEVRALGYGRRVDSVELGRDAGLVLRVPVKPMPHDECPGFLVVSRRPWWKWW